MSDKSGRKKIFRAIRKAYTLSSAAQKSARRVTHEDLSLIADAAMVEVDGKIAWLGPERNLPEEWRSGPVEIIDLHGAVILPAFVECHSHLVYAGNRASEFERRQSGESYQQIAQSGGGILSTVQATHQASEDELFADAEVRARRLINQGVATLEIKSGYGLTLESEKKILRAAARVRGPRILRSYLGAHAIPRGQDAESYLAQMINEDLPAIAKEKLAERVDIFVEVGYFSVEQARRYAVAAQSLGLSVCMHADQLTRTGASLLAVELNAHSADHVIQINSSDIDRLAASDVTAVLLPAADLYMRCAYPPARDLSDKGARVALATDHNPGTSPTLDLALVGLLARLEMKMSLSEVIVAYTLGAAHALGIAQLIGSLERGKQCDFIALSSDIHDLFYRAGEMPVMQTFRDGVAISI